MRRDLGLVLLVLLQIASGLLLGFAVTYVLGFDNPMKLLVIGTGTGLGVWGVGATAQFRGSASPSFWSLVMTVSGAFLGVLVILFAVPFSFAALLLPLLGALVGYYLGGQ